jgi:hypothetical protein
MINCMLPSPNNSIRSLYFLNKSLDPWILQSNCREYCAECQRLWKDDEVQCPNCADCGAVTYRYKGTKEDQILKRKKTHFLTFSVVEQLQSLISCKLWLHLQSNSTSWGNFRFIDLSNPSKETSTKKYGGHLWWKEIPRMWAFSSSFHFIWSEYWWCSSIFFQLDIHLACVLVH